MNYKQLELFQPLGKHESNIFEQAKKLKFKIQKIYNSTEILLSEVNSLKKEKYVILKINVDLDLIGDKDSLPEPINPKIYIWQFTPSIEILINGETKIILEKGDTYQSIGPKIIPKWMHTNFTKNEFSKNEFLDFTMQYFTLNLINEILINKENATLLSKYKSEIDSKNLLIYFESKLFSKKSDKVYSLYEKDILNKIFNYYTKMKNTQKTNWYFVSSQFNFTDQDDFLNDIDTSQLLIEKDKDNNDQSVTELFQNDYLLLNNCDIFHPIINTNGWDKDCVISPKFLNSTYTDIDEVRLSKLSDETDEKKIAEKRKIYCYLKKQTSQFIRTEILFPTNNINSTVFKEIISIARSISTL